MTSKSRIILRGEAGAKPIIVKFVSHKKKAELYKQRTKLRNTSLSDVVPEASAASIVSSKGIYINENLTSFRRELLKGASKKRKNNIISSAWTIDGKVFVKISPASRPIRRLRRPLRINKFSLSLMISRRFTDVTCYIF